MMKAKKTIVWFGLSVFCLAANLSSAVLIDDFESYATGALRTVASPPWVAIENTSGANISAADDNKFLTYGLATYTRGAYIGVPPVGNTSKATLFAKIYATTAGVNHSFGLSHLVAPGQVLDHFQVQMVAVSGPTSGQFNLQVRNGGTAVTCATLNRQAWYNVWAIIDQATDTYDVYVTSGEAIATEADKIASGMSFRTGTTAALSSFLAMSYQQGGNFRIDDIHLLDGVSLLNPPSHVFIAHAPFPADGASDVPQDAVLSWTTGIDPNNLEQANPAITHHYLYFRDTDANFLNPTTLKVLLAVDGPTGSYVPTAPYDLKLDKTYYWRVDEVRNYGSPTNPDDIIIGQTWNFGSRRSAPVVTGDPAAVLVSEDDDAVFTVSLTSQSPAACVWYKAVDGVNDAALSNGTKYTLETDGTNYATLVVKNATAADQGYYYCVLSSPGGSDSSAQAALAITQLKSHWTLDSLVDGQYADVTGHYPAEPNGIPVFVDGVKPAVTGQGVHIDRANGAASAGTWNPSEFSNQLTLSLWAKWAGHHTPAAYQGVIAKRNAWGPDNMMWQVEIDQTSGNLSYKNGSNNAASAGVLPVGQWVHFVVTVNGTTATLYRDGLSVGTGTVPFSAKTDANLVLGAVQQNDAGVLSDCFNGVLDDIRIYNYAFDKYGVADLYYAVTGTGLCLETSQYTAAYDHDKNCKIDLGDFVMLASEWLRCGRYPLGACND